ncbi:MAG: RHS repeat-associated core domain-containing protein [Bergeyella cardium]
MHSNKYDPQGRIIENDQLGTISFDDNKKVYQPTSIYLNSTGNKLFNYGHIENIAYNENNDPVFINGVKGDVLFEYGLTHMRQLVSFGGEVDNEKRHGRYTRYYSEDGTFEVTLDHSNGSEKSIIYIGGSPYESNIIYIKDFNEDSEGSYKFLHKDYLGSILAISDEKGDKLEQRHYDAWGNLTHLQIRDNEIISDPDKIEKKILLIDRGYTSHEHFQEVGIIHMNGRLYAPLLRRFLNADENIQDPYNTQNYNKYGYVLNNPLMYNDPSGEFVFAIFAALPAFWGAAATAAVIGATVGLASYTIGLAVTGNLDQWNIGGALKATLFGAISGAATFGLGELFAAGKVVQALGGVKFLAQAAAHGVSQGVLSVLQGGDFLQGFASGALGSLGAEAFGQIVGSWSSSTGGQIFFGALSGGVGAELTGGNFWQGAAIGGIVAGLNHVMHKMGGEDPIPSSKERTWYEKAVNFFSGGALDEAEWMLSLKDLSTVERGLVIGAHFSKQARYEFMYARGSRGMALGLKNNIAGYGVKSILNKAGALTRLKGNVKQGMLKGDANNIFKSMAKSYGAKIQNKGKETFFQTGNLRVGLHNSAKAQGLPTIHINDGGKIYKIRVTE